MNWQLILTSAVFGSMVSVIVTQVFFYLRTRNNNKTKVVMTEAQLKQHATVMSTQLLAQANEQIDRLQRASDEERAYFREQIAELRNHMTTRDTANAAIVAGLEKRIGELEGKLDVSQQDRERLIKENRDLRTSEAALTEKVALLEQRAKELQAEVDHLRRELVARNIILPDLDIKE